MSLKCLRFYYSVHYTCTHVLFTFRNFTLHSAVHRLSVASVCGQSELSAAAKRKQCGSPTFNRNKTPHPKTVQCKTGYDKHVKQAISVLPSGQRAGSLKTKGRKFQYQPADLGVRHGMRFSFLFSPSVLLTYPRKKPGFTQETGRHMRLNRGQAK